MTDSKVNQWKGKPIFTIHLPYGGKKSVVMLDLDVTVKSILEPIFTLRNMILEDYIAMTESDKRYIDFNTKLNAIDGPLELVLTEAARPRKSPPKENATVTPPASSTVKLKQSKTLKRAHTEHVKHLVKKSFTHRKSDSEHKDERKIDSSPGEVKKSVKTSDGSKNKSSDKWFTVGKSTKNSLNSKRQSLSFGSTKLFDTTNPSSKKLSTSGSSPDKKKRLSKIFQNEEEKVSTPSSLDKKIIFSKRLSHTVSKTVWFPIDEKEFSVFQASLKQIEKPNEKPMNSAVHKKRQNSKSLNILEKAKKRASLNIDRVPVSRNDTGSPERLICHIHNKMVKYRSHLIIKYKERGSFFDNKPEHQSQEFPVCTTLHAAKMKTILQNLEEFILTKYIEFNNKSTDLIQCAYKLLSLQNQETTPNIKNFLHLYEYLNRVMIKIFPKFEKLEKLIQDFSKISDTPALSTFVHSLWSLVKPYQEGEKKSIIQTIISIAIMFSDLIENATVKDILIFALRISRMKCLWKDKVSIDDDYILLNINYDRSLRMISKKDNSLHYDNIRNYVKELDGLKKQIDDTISDYDRYYVQFLEKMMIFNVSKMIIDTNFDVYSNFMNEKFAECFVYAQNSQNESASNLNGLLLKLSGLVKISESISDYSDDESLAILPQLVKMCSEDIPLKAPKPQLQTATFQRNRQKWFLKFINVDSIFLSQIISSTISEILHKLAEKNVSVETVNLFKILRIITNRFLCETTKTKLGIEKIQDYLHQYTSIIYCIPDKYLTDYLIDLTSINVTGVNFTGCNLTGIKFTEQQLATANFVTYSVGLNPEQRLKVQNLKYENLKRRLTQAKICISEFVYMINEGNLLKILENPIDEKEVLSRLSEYNEQQVKVICFYVITSLLINRYETYQNSTINFPYLDIDVEECKKRLLEIFRIRYFQLNLEVITWTYDIKIGYFYEEIGNIKKIIFSDIYSLTSDLLPEHQTIINEMLQELKQQIKSVFRQEKDIKEKAIENRLNSLIDNLSSPPELYLDEMHPEGADIRRITDVIELSEELKKMKFKTELGQDVFFPIDLSRKQLPKNFGQIDIPLDVQFKLTQEQILRDLSKEQRQLRTQSFLKAIQSGSFEKVNNWIKLGVEINGENKENKFPLMEACLCDKVNLDIVKLLLENNADANYTPISSDMSTIEAICRQNINTDNM